MFTIFYFSVCMCVCVCVCVCVSVSVNCKLPVHFHRTWCNKKVEPSVDLCPEMMSAGRLV